MKFSGIKLFSQKASLQKKGKWRIYISTNSYKILKNVIFSYFISSMLYKYPIPKTIKDTKGLFLFQL